MHRCFYRKKCGLPYQRNREESYEEFEKYFLGEQSEEALVNHLENRIGLFLEEKE